MALLPNLVSYYKLEEASGNRADSKGSNTLSPTNAPGNASGKIGNAVDLELSSGQWLSASDNATLDFTTKLSVFCWINQEAALGTDRGIVVKWDYQTQGSWGFQTDQNNNDELQVFIADALNDAGNNRGYTTAANLSAGTFYHVGFVYDGDGVANADKLKIYVNSSNQSLTIDGTIPASLQNSTADLRVGNWGGTLNTRYYDGLVDELGIWGRALTQTDINKLYNGGNGLQYPFGELGGNPLFFSSGTVAVG